jgi:nucleoside 2-deoxyribosyltransferase
MKLIYLSGPIAGCTDAECRNWRAEFASKWPGATLDPMRHDYRTVEDMSDHLANAIVEGDLKDIRVCDGVVVYHDRTSVGTSMEIVYAHFAGKPIVVIDARPDRFAVVNPWLWYHATEIVSGIDQAINQLAELTR